LDLHIAAEPFESDDARRLIGELDAHLAEWYPPAQRFGPNLKPEQLGEGKGVFVIARLDGRAVGCGAIRLLDATTAEAKRMYVEPELRGRGIGRAVLDALEAKALAIGVRRLVLETGVHQHAAIALYLHARFTQVDCWGEYATSATSVCYEKNL
jgi:GNAT superfamily N-acetyltransferase